MQIDDLMIPHLTQLTYEKQIELLLQVRARRRVVPERKQAKVRVAKIKKVSNAMLNSLSREQLLQIAVLLEKGK